MLPSRDGHWRCLSWLSPSWRPLSYPAGGTQWHGGASRSRQVDGEVAAFVRVCMQAAEVHLLVTKQLLGNVDSRVALGQSSLRLPSSSGSSFTPGSPKPQYNARSLTSRDCGQSEGIPEVKLEDCRGENEGLSVQRDLFLQH